MTLNELGASALQRELSGPGIALGLGPFTARLTSNVPSVGEYLSSHYGQFSLDEGRGAHFNVDIATPSGVRRWLRPQVTFRTDGQFPFFPVPVRMAPALVEWGLNWCIARRVHHLMVIHSAVVSRRGAAVLLPAPPESGKSTLCAALVGHGWQFGSDEFALVDPQTGLIHPLPRPVSLKNGSVDIIRARWEAPHFGPEVIDPQGTCIRYLRPPARSVQDAAGLVRARWIAIPRYRAGSATVLEPSSRGATLAHLADSSYNFSQFGREGFDCLAGIVDGARGFTLTYSNTDEALAVFDRLEQDFRNENAELRAGTAA